MHINNLKSSLTYSKVNGILPAMRFRFLLSRFADMDVVLGYVTLYQRMKALLQVTNDFGLDN